MHCERRKYVKVLVSVLLVCVTGLVEAREAGDWLLRAGAHTIQPKSDNATIDALAADVEVDDATMATFNLTYMVTPSVGVELLAALPFEHDIDIGGQTLASTKHLPPTLSVIYAFNPGSRATVYAGLGVNATLFFQEDMRGALDGAKLTLDNSYGAAALVGIDVSLTDNLFLNADVRYFDIDTDATVTAPGVRLEETVEIDPWAVGVNLGYRF